MEKRRIGAILPSAPPRAAADKPTEQPLQAVTLPRLFIALAGIFILLAAGLAQPGLAQTLPGTGGGEAAPAAEPAPVDPLGRDTVRGMVAGLLDALGSGNVERARSYLDLSRLPQPAREWRGTQYVASLQSVLDRAGEILPTSQLAAEPAGALDDGLPAGVDVFARVRTPDGPQTLTANRVPGPDGAQIWLVSPYSLDLATRLAVSTPGALIERALPRSWSQIRMFGAPVSHWVALVLLAAAAFVIARAAVALLLWGAERVAGPLREGVVGPVARAICLPLGIVLAVVLFSASAGLLGLSIVARTYVAPAVQIAVWIAVAVLAWRLTDELAGRWLDNMSRRGRPGAVSVVTLLRRAGKVAIAFLFTLAIFNAVGVNLTAWLAAFGIGGIAIALGAQKTIENLVGSLSIIADRPIRIGDFCKVDGISGTVEDIGMRSTRLRTAERTVVTIPNGLLSAARIENFADRDRFLYKVLVSLRYETTLEQMNAVLTRLRGLIDGDRRVATEGRHVRFVALAGSSLDVEVLGYIMAVDGGEFLAVSEELNLAILEIVRDCGTDFAFPSQTVYLERGENPPAPDGGGAVDADGAK